MKKAIPSLDGLRAISILFVLLGHLQLKSFHNYRIPIPIPLLFDGGFGVIVFFVISGFLITKLLLQEESLGRGVSFKNFYIRRTFRIFPAFYFLLFVYFVLQLFSVLYFTTSSWISSIFYLKDITGWNDWESAHFWSLGIEEHFYLAWPLVFVFSKKYRVHFAIVSILVCIFCRLNVSLKIIPFNLLSQGYSIFQKGDALMVGCLFALFETRLTNRLMPFIRLSIAPFILIFLIAFFSAELIPDLNRDHHWHIGRIIEALNIGSSSGTFTSILVGILILSSINSKAGWFRFLNLGPVRFVGKLSYSIYLWQQLFFSEKMMPLSKFPINLVFIFLAACFSYFIVEKPFLRLKARFEPSRNTN